MPQDDDFEIAFSCLFCGGEIAEGASDFCELNFATAAGFGTFTCHAGCLRERAHDSEHFPDIETPAESGADHAPSDPVFLAAWDELAEVLGQIHHAELDDADQVRSLMHAIEDAANRHGIVIEQEGPQD